MQPTFKPHLTAKRPSSTERENTYKRLTVNRNQNTGQQSTKNLTKPRETSKTVLFRRSNR